MSDKTEEAGISQVPVDTTATSPDVLDADLAQDAFDGIYAAGGYGEERDVTLGLVLREVRLSGGDGGVGALGDGGDDDLATPFAGDEDQRNVGADGDIVDNEAAVHAGDGASHG